MNHAMFEETVARGGSPGPAHAARQPSVPPSDGPPPTIADSDSTQRVGGSLARGVTLPLAEAPRALDLGGLSLPGW
jgi:hypothetical protein